MKTIEELIIEPLRNEIFNNLLLLPEGSHKLFRRMYSPKDDKKPLNEILNEMNESQLRIAYMQVYNTIHKSKN